MINQHIRSASSGDTRDTELELLEALLLADATYPWNPADPESETVLASVEEEFLFPDWQAEEISVRSQAFYHKLEQLWPVATPSQTPAPINLVVELQASLKQHFSTHIPIEWLEIIATRAKELKSGNLSLGEILVQCVQPLLPNWGEEDLQVLARPFAYAMRGSELTEGILAGVSLKSWEELSEIDRIRLSLAAARYALDKLPA